MMSLIKSKFTWSIWEDIHPWSCEDLVYLTFSGSYQFHLPYIYASSLLFFHKIWLLFYSLLFILKLYNHIFAIFEKFQKFHFLDKKLYFEGFRLGFSNWKVNPSILGNLQLLNQGFVSWKSSLETKKRRF